METFSCEQQVRVRCKQGVNLFFLFFRKLNFKSSLLLGLFSPPLTLIYILSKRLYKKKQ